VDRILCWLYEWWYVLFAPESPNKRKNKEDSS
jgi:hypothetical protein